MGNSETATIDAIAGCRARLDAMCSALDEDAWQRPTALPGWTVQDVVAHLGSLEALLLGRDEPAHQVGPAEHVRNPLGALNERLVDRRRAWTGAQVLDEFREMSAYRLERLRELTEAELDAEVTGPTGRPMPQRAFIGVRLWDYLVHEVDVADALGVEPDLDSPAARRVLGEMVLLLPRAVAKGGAGDGTTLVLTLASDPPVSWTVRQEAGRASLAEPMEAAEASLHLRTSSAAFLRVASGRREPSGALAAGDIEASGDADLAVRVLTALNVVP